MNPLIATIPSAKTPLSAADTTALLNAVVALTPLPAGKSVADVRQYTILVSPQTGASTATVSFK